MMIVCTDNSYFKVFNASSSASPIPSSYSYYIGATPLETWDGWDVNANGTSIYYTTTNYTYRWDYSA